MVMFSDGMELCREMKIEILLSTLYLSINYKGNTHDGR